MNAELLIVEYINLLSASMRESERKFKEQDKSGELFNLSITQLHYLHAIAAMHGVTYKALAEKFNVQKSTVTDSVNRLMRRNLIRKEQSVEDLRVYHLYVTDKGESALAAEKQGYYDFACRMTRCLSPEEAEQFTQMLDKITKEIGDVRR